MILDAAVTILVFVTVFVLIYRGMVDRRVAVLSGAAVILLYGMASRFFSVEMAVDSIYFETLSLIFGMSAITDLLVRSGFFAMVAQRVMSYASGSRWLVLVLLTLTTYGVSLLVNNLATMLALLPVTLALCRDMGMRPAPILMAEIIASNLGGASTMVGDFPNMIISSAGQLNFLDFIGGMMVPCLVLLAVMLWYFQMRRKEMGLSASSTNAPSGMVTALPIDKHDTRLGLSILAGMLIGFLVFDALDIRPGWVAFAGGLAALAFSWRSAEVEDWFAVCGGEDILFFVGLFVMVGGLAAAGVLDGASWLIARASGGSDVAGLVVLMWVVAGFTVILNAGPATAFFVPVAEQMYLGLADTTVWWALSLGVLAGSSAALTGATAGSVAATHLDRFVAAHPSMAVVPGHRLDFKSYLRWGMPMAGIFLVLSNLYVIAVAR